MAARHWFLTCSFWKAVKNMPEDGWRDTKNIRYIVYQLEVGKKTQYCHLHFYIELVNPQRISWIKRYIGCDSVHVKRRKKTRENARDYCMKEETRICGPFVFGTFIGGKGERTDIISLYNDVKSGLEDVSLQEDHPVTYFKYYKAIDRVRANMAREESLCFRKLNIKVLIGDAGVGKTSLIFKLHGFGDVYILERPTTYGNVWFDGYMGQKVLLIDDFYGWLPWGFLLRLLDGYPLRLSIKGGFTYATFTTIYITSNRRPNQWYDRGFPKEIRRRINGGVIRLEKSVSM